MKDFFKLVWVLIVIAVAIGYSLLKEDNRKRQQENSEHLQALALKWEKERQERDLDRLLGKHRTGSQFNQNWLKPIPSFTPVPGLQPTLTLPPEFDLPQPEEAPMPREKPAVAPMPRPR